MQTFKVIFTIRNGMHPFTEVVKAESIDQVQQVIKQLTKEAGVSLKQIVSIIAI